MLFEQWADKLFYVGISLIQSCTQYANNLQNSDRLWHNTPDQFQQKMILIIRKWASCYKDNDHPPCCVHVMVQNFDWYKDRLMVWWRLGRWTWYPVRLRNTGVWQAYAALQTILLHMKRLNETESSPILFFRVFFVSISNLLSLILLWHRQVQKTIDCKVYPFHRWSISAWKRLKTTATDS